MKLTSMKLILTAVCSAIIGVLAFFAAITTTVVPGVAAIYPAAALEVVFGVWFGLWGGLASYLGLLIAGTLGGWFPLHLGLILSSSDFLLAFLPALFFHLVKLDPELTRVRDVILFIVGSVIVGSVPGSIIYNYINFKLGVLPTIDAFWVAIIGWNLGNLIVIPVIGIPLLKTLTRFVRRSGLYFPIGSSGTKKTL